ncbi:hypothetical protein QTG54_000403 [Skeletonema marinoi]|uniref:Uncharacterized protein n=1 Tax=Skeletonema marinoi TaxID=267567 RepID=A0AAD8YKV5_9STRA|nr:hypothetical protein QTG54_000403 [Skeletonema marinoi]
MDYVTMQKLCSLSATLPYWWILWFASIVTFGSAADARRLVDGDDVTLAKESCDLAIAIGVISFLLASFFILSHYEFLTCCGPCRTWMSYGGIFELTIIVFVDIWQVIATHTLTSAGKIGSTITGQGEGVAEDYVPGSNIYFAVWASLAASMSITVKWKQARAMKFAQTQNEVNEEERLGDDEEA